MIKKVLTWFSISFLIFFVAYRPQAAAGVFRSIGHNIVNVFEAVWEFFKSLTAAVGL